MTRDQARDYIKESWRRLYPAAADGKGIICPICGHGTHGDGIVKNRASDDPNGLKCFSCSFSGDVISLIEQDMSMDYNEALQYAADQLNITIDSTPYNPPRSAQEPRKVQEVQEHTEAQEKQEEPNQADYTGYYRACRERLADPRAAAYLKQRGISMETAAAYWLGFDPEADPANAPGAGDNDHKPHPAPRIIIPTNAGHYVGRAIDPDNKYKKMNAKDSKPGIFNERALYSTAPAVFVTEGVFDALSIIEAGAPAIALCSTTNTGSFLTKMEHRPTTATLILTFDQDDAGRRYTQPLREGLDRLNISHITGDVCGEYGDPNEALTGDRTAFIEAVKRDQRRAGTKPDNTGLYIDQLMSADIERFRKAGDRKTGFSNLDEQAGGLYSGLYVLAATSSLGKTTWALQLADQLATAGHDVIFFSLEQSRLELVSKSLARITAQADPAHAVTALQIRQGYKYDEVLDAIDDYKTAIADRLSIVEGNFNCDLSFIGDYVRQYIRQNGEEHRPIVIVDYLQILTPEKDDRGRTPSTKEAVDAAVTGLKRLSREQDLTVIVISSVNRANYQQPIDFESLKESGGIEYSADVVYGLQLRCLNDDLFSQEKKIKEKREKIKEEKAKTPREIELVCLKNRYGISSFSCNFDYYPANDLFTVADRYEPTQRPAAKRR